MKFLLPSYYNIKALIGCMLILLAANRDMAQQSASYTQYMDNLTPLNSAYSMLDKAASVSTLVREQYVGIVGAPNTFIFNANLPIESINGAAGLVINNDNFAVEHQLLANLYFAKAIQVANTSFLSVSLDAGLRNYVADYAGLAPGDPVFTDDVRETKANVGFGVLLYSDRYYLGISVPQLTFRDLGDGSLLSNDYFRNHYYFAGAYLADLADYIKVKPSVLVSYVRGVPTIADISAIFYFKQVLGVGFTVRTNSEMAAIVSYDINNFHIGYSYEFGTTYSDIGGPGNATHEVTLAYRFGKGAGTPKVW
jgi:type IX secretion system PorP/SprF family membrane protein